MRRNGVAGRLGGILADEFFQRSQSSYRKLRPRKKDCGQGRLGQVCKRDVVESDQRNVAWDFETGVVDGAERADGGQIVRSDDGRWAILEVKKIPHRGHATF